MPCARWYTPARMRCLRPSTLCFAAALLTVGCTNTTTPSSLAAADEPTPAPGAARNKPSSLAAADGPTSTPGADAGKPDGPLEITLEWPKSGRCVSLQPGGPCYRTLDEVREAAPDLHARVKSASILADVIHALEPGHGDELFKTVDGYEAWWAKWFEPPHFFEFNYASVGAKPSRPATGEIEEPKLQGAELVFFTGRVVSSEHGMQAFRIEVDFASKDWKPKSSELACTSQVRAGLNDRAEAIFGGLVDGFARAGTPVGTVYLAAKPAGDAAPFVWRMADGSLKRFKRWSALVAKHPQAGSKSVAIQIATAAANYPLQANSQLIEDAAAYRKEYKDAGWGVLNLRYWVDQLRVTEYSVANWDEIVDPVIADGVLVAHFKNSDHQPERMTYALSGFAAQAPVRLVPEYSSKVISDTRGEPLVPLHPEPVSGRIEPKAQRPASAPR